MPLPSADSLDSITLPEIGQLTMQVALLEHGRVRYSVRGRHIRGSFVIVPEALTDGTVLPSTVTVQFGCGDETGDYWRTPRPDEPVIYNVRIHGWTDGLDPDNPPSGWFLDRYASSLRDNGSHRELTYKVRRRTEAVVRGLVRHWSRLPHRLELVTEAARCKAAELAKHEAERAACHEADVEALRGKRAVARRRMNVITGIIRRRPRPLHPAVPAAVSLPLVDAKGTAMGLVSVREVAVSDVVPGSVVYEVAGARVQGRFTVGCDRFRPLPLPQGIRVTYGHVRSPSPYSGEQEHEPTVHGVRVGGIWDRETTADITASFPARLGAQARTGIRAGISASAAAERRCSAVLRALVLHHLARADIEALRLAAAKSNAAEQLATTGQLLRELREQQRKAERKAVLHRERERQYRALL